MKRKIGIIAVASLVLLCLVFGLAWGQNIGAIKQRMLNRLPQIQALKAKGIIGENNRGYLAYVGDKRVKQEMIQAENADRKAVYQAIAKQQNTSVAVVEKHRAAQIEKEAKPGTWLQDATGKWYQK